MDLGKLYQCTRERLRVEEEVGDGEYEMVQVGDSNVK